MPMKIYLGIGGALFFLTIVTVAVAQVHLGPLNLIVALAVAVVKATLVGLYFMHLKYDHRLYSLVFVSAVVFLGIFITLTMLDTTRRGDIYEQVEHPIRPDAVIYHPALPGDTLQSKVPAAGH